MTGLGSAPAKERQDARWRFYWHLIREVGLGYALSQLRADLGCWRHGHVWVHDETWESWDEGAQSKTEEFWMCSHCDLFSAVAPEGWTA